MRKIVPLMLLFLLSGIVRSQTIQLTNGGSTTTAGATSANPISQYFEFIHFQVVYTAAELNAAGITGAKTVSQLGWYVSTAPANGLPSYRIRMANTSATNSAAHDASTLTEVYNVASYTPTAGGFDMLTLNGSFIWDGTSNLLVDVCFGAAVYASPYGDVRTYAASTTSGSRRVRCDGCGSQCGNATNTTNSFKPQVSLTFTPPPSCLAPAGLVATPTATTASLSWGSVSGASGYEWAVTTSATPPASGTAVAGTSANATGLTDNTVYYLHVRANCGGPFSGWSTLQFRTLCAVTSVPYTENFDGSGSLPTCFAFQDLNGATTWSLFTGGGGGASSAPNSIRYNWDGTAPGDDWFFIRGINLTAGTSYRLSFKYKASNGPTFVERLEVKYGTAPNAASMTSGTLLTNNNINNAVADPFIDAAIDFIPASSGSYYVGFHCTSIPDQAFLYIDDISVTLSPSCGAPTALNVALSSGTAGTASWTAPTVGTPTGYEYVIDNIPGDPAGAGTAVAGTSTPFSGLTPNLLYYLHVRTNCGGTFSSWTTISFSTVVNDAPCNATTLTLGGPQDCGNTAAATSVGDPALSCSAPNNTVWYKYTPAANGVVLVRTEIPGATANALNGWVAFYTATGTCPTPGLTLTQLGLCTEFGQTGAGDVDTITSPVLTAGTTYYILIDGFGGDNGEYCINLIAPPPPPACTTNLTPANAATGVTSVLTGVVLTWNAAPTATSYDIFFGTTNPPTTNIGNVTGTTATITGTNYNTIYYWYIVPRNTGGPATGCQTSTFSFTTENPTNCTPIYTTGCTLGDSIAYFSLKGDGGTAIYNYSGDSCTAATPGPRAYADYTSIPAPTLATNNSYSGFIQSGFADNYVSIWIDGDDDGFFEDNERLLNNLAVNTTRKLYSIYIPGTMPLGAHRMRVRMVYYATRPTAPTHPCNPYAWGETEDYSVNITNVGPTGRLAASGTPGSCMDVSETTIDAASNSNINGPVFLLDSLNNFVVAVYPDGNNLGTVKANYYVHNGPVRQDVTGRYYLDRNISIGVDTQPATPYRMRYYFRNAELNALIAQPGSGVTSIFDLVMTKTLGIECVTQYVQQTPTLVNPVGFGSVNGDRFVDFTGLTGFSRFFLHGGSSVLLPVTLSNFSGQVTGATNTLYWTTTTESNNNKFVIERSLDGVTFTTLGEVGSRAANGNSTTPISYNFVDANPVEGKAFYRLKLVDLNGRNTQSPVVTLLRGKGGFEIVDVRPNPTSGKLYFNVIGNQGNSLQLVVRSINGQEVSRQQLVQSNNFQVDLSNQSKGIYMLEVTDRRSGARAIYNKSFSLNKKLLPLRGSFLFLPLCYHRYSYFFWQQPVRQKILLTTVCLPVQQQWQLTETRLLLIRQKNYLI
jgi:hypothetical protein